MVKFIFILGLTVEEKKELEHLRVDIKRYRDLEGNEEAGSDVTKSVKLVT
jgi:hypothetical protein